MMLDLIETLKTSVYNQNVYFKRFKLFKTNIFKKQIKLKIISVLC